MFTTRSIILVLTGTPASLQLRELKLNIQSCNPADGGRFKAPREGGGPEPDETVPWADAVVSMSGIRSTGVIYQALSASHEGALISVDPRVPLSGTGPPKPTRK